MPGWLVCCVAHWLAVRLWWCWAFCLRLALAVVVVVVVLLLLIKEYESLTQLSVALQSAEGRNFQRGNTTQGKRELPINSFRHLCFLADFWVPAHCPRKRKRFIYLRISASEQTWPCPGVRCCRSAWQAGTHVCCRLSMPTILLWRLGPGMGGWAGGPAVSTHDSEASHSCADLAVSSSRERATSVGREEAQEHLWAHAGWTARRAADI